MPNYENPRGFSIRFVFAKLVAQTRNEIIHKHVVCKLKNMRKLIIILLLTSALTQGQNSKTGLEIGGKVKAFIGKEWVEIKDATIELIQKKKICDLDNSGKYKFTGLEPGSYELRVLNFNKDPKVFIIELINKSVNDFDLYIDIKCEFDKSKAIEDLKKGKPKLLLIGGIAPVHHLGQEKIEKKYGFEYYDFGCTPPPMKCVIDYNKTIFKHLDTRFKSWRKNIREDVIGLN